MATLSGGAPACADPAAPSTAPSDTNKRRNQCSGLLTLISTDTCADVGELLLDLGVVAGGAPRGLFQPLVLLVAAVVLLDEDGRPPALLETLLLVVRAELGLDQDGRLGHLLIERVLRGEELHR